MSAQIDPNKTSIDLGVSIRDSAASLKFYCETLGLEHVMDMPMPLGSGGTMHRIACGSSTLKLTKMNDEPKAQNPGGGPAGGVGIRYFTLWISNLDEMVAKCEAGGYAVVQPIREVRPGTRIAIVEDPDGNWVEFLQQG
jgi:catechol 2,3-dioxygenase-like lactoylglutathione lyase family enzyme